MKNYKDFKKEFIGESDISSLVAVGCDAEGALQSQFINFGEDGAYFAYMADGSDVEIGAHYKKIATFYWWLKIYDDEELTLKVDAPVIDIYRSGMRGCIIHSHN